MHGLTVERESGLVVIRMAGELDAFAAPDLDRVFAEIHGSQRVVVELERLTFLDSTALGRIVRGVRELLENDARVRVVLPRGTARRIFEITTLDRALPVAESLATAATELGAREPAGS